MHLHSLEEVSAVQIFESRGLTGNSGPGKLPSMRIFMLPWGVHVTRRYCMAILPFSSGAMRPNVWAWTSNWFAIHSGQLHMNTWLASELQCSSGQFCTCRTIPVRYLHCH